jgi:hypothetical protein
LKDWGEFVVKAQQSEQGGGFFGGTSGLAVYRSRRPNRVSIDGFGQHLERKFFGSLGIQDLRGQFRS